MEIFRTGHDIWGRTVLEGLSWDLLGVAVGIGTLVILGHAIGRLFRRKRSGV